MDPIRLHFIVDTDELSSRFSPALGIGYLSSYLKANLTNVKTSLSYRDEDYLSDIERHQPDIIGLSCTSRYFSDFKKIAEGIGDRFHIPIIWGGTHISLSPHELPVSAHLAVIGEGEETLLDLLRNFQSGKFMNLENIPGIAYHKYGNILVNPTRPLISPLDRIPSPDTDLLRVKWDKYHRAVMMTSRGCPCKCRFCASSKFWDKTRLFSPGYVVEEMAYLARRFGVREILIYDDFFTVSKARIQEITQMAKGRPELKKMKYEILSRADHFNEEIARHLRTLGVYRISFGIESGNQKTLNYLKNDSLRIEEAEKAIDIAKSCGFECVGSFIIGSPYESADEIEDTFRFIKKLHLDSVQITIATPFPGTQMWEDGKALGVISGDDWSDDYYAMFAFSPYQSTINLLNGKKLLTRIPREEFNGLVEKSDKLMFQNMFSLKGIVKLTLQNIVMDPLSLPKNIAQGTLHYLKKRLGVN